MCGVGGVGFSDSERRSLPKLESDSSGVMASLSDKISGIEEPKDDRLDTLSQNLHEALKVMFAGTSKSGSQPSS